MAKKAFLRAERETEFKTPCPELSEPLTACADRVFKWLAGEYNQKFQCVDGQPFRIRRK